MRSGDFFVEEMFRGGRKIVEVLDSIINVEIMIWAEFHLDDLVVAVKS